MIINEVTNNDRYHNLKLLNNQLDNVELKVSLWKGRSFYNCDTKESLSYSETVKKFFELQKSIQNDPNAATPVSIKEIEVFQKISSKLETLHQTSKANFFSKTLLKVISVWSKLAKNPTINSKMLGSVRESVDETKNKIISSSPLKQIKITHGTKMSTLVMMSKPSDFQYSLVPFGQLKQHTICFAGELHKGIGDNGVNQGGSSWTSSIETGIDYAKKFNFNLGQIGEKLNNICDSYQNRNDYNFASLQRETSTSSYNNVIMQIKQFRAFNEENYQDYYKKNLVEWANFLIEDYEKQNDNQYANALAKARELLIVLQDEEPIQLEEKDQAHIKNNIPLLFASINEEGVQEGALHLEERLVKKSMRLGDDIQIIATKKKDLEKAQEYVKAAGLDEKVQIVSFGHLRRIHQIPHQK